MADLGTMLVMLATLAMPAAGQLSARQIVANNLRVRGGAARFQAVHGFVMHATLALRPAAPLAVWSASNPARIRIEVGLPGGKLTQGWDGHRAWQIAPGQTRAVFLEGKAAQQVEDQALNGVDLFTAPGTRIELLGRAHVAGHDAYRLRITLQASGDAFVQYVDAKTWLVFHEEYPGGVEDIGDYRSVGGLLLPFRFVSGPAGQPGVAMVRSRMEINPPLPATLFMKGR